MVGARHGAALVLLALVHASPVPGGCQPVADPIPGSIPQGPFTVKLQDVASNLVWPIDVAAPPDGSNRLFVTYRDGRVVVIKNGSLLATPFLDITATTVLDAGSAMSSIAFHPDFAAAGSDGEGKLYTVSQEASGTAPADFGPDAGVAHQSVIYEWRADTANPDVVDPSSQREVLRINEATTVHNVDELAFGPDGYLYVTKGDDDANASAVIDGTDIHGSILRIDVDGRSVNGKYDIPPGNPFVGNGEGRIEEIWAYGFRNPWRAGFDRNNGVYYVADIGEDDIEEINAIEPGRSFGWIEKEGSFVFLDFSGVTADLSCLPPGFDSVDPAVQYDHTEGDRSITGGFVYRGSLLPELTGHYVFGDWISGRLMHAAPNSGLIQELAIDPGGASLGPGIIGIGEDTDGELLLVVTQTDFSATGRLIRIVEMSSTPAGPPPGAPDGSAGAAMTASRLDPAGTELSIAWDTISCPEARAYHVLFGRGADLPAFPGAGFQIAGSRCKVGITSPFVWRGAPDPAADPSGLVWWLIVAHDGAGVEGSWGRGSDDTERMGPASGGSSGQCAFTTKSLVNTCGQ